MNAEELIQIALGAGASKATVVDAGRIALSEEFPKICERNDCGNYGRTWTCPPYPFGVERAMERVRSFDRALWYSSVGALEDGFDYEGMVEAARRHAELGQRIHLGTAPLLKGDFLHLSCGICSLCESCTRPEGKPCRHPERALDAMEGWGVDVYNTTRGTGLAYVNGQNTVTYFGMLLFREEEDV